MQLWGWVEATLRTHGRLSVGGEVANLLNALDEATLPIPAPFQLNSATTVNLFAYVHDLIVIICKKL